MSGSLTPFVKLYDRFYFTPEHEPCRARYIYDKALVDQEHQKLDIPTDTFEHYIDALNKKNPFSEDFKYEKIEIVEKEPDDIDVINNPIAAIPPKSTIEEDKKDVK